MSKNKFVLITFLIVSFFELRSQPKTPLNFDHITVRQGLSQSTVFAIAKDRDGFMWFGTRDGLCRYDSRSIKVYRSDDSPQGLKGNSIHCLLVDNEGKLWIGSNEGVNIYDKYNDNFTHVALGSRPRSNQILSMVQDKTGVIWIGTMGGLIRIANTATMQSEIFYHDSTNNVSLQHDEVRSLYVDSENTLWVATTVGVANAVHVGAGKYSFTNYGIYPPKGHQKSWVNCLSEDQKGNILIGTEQNGIELLDKQTGKISHANIALGNRRRQESVRVINHSEGKYWIGTIDGLFIYDPETSLSTPVYNDPDDPTTLNDNSIRSIFADDTGCYWLGTFYGGVNMHSPLSRQFHDVRLVTKRNQKAFKIASAMLTDNDGNLWVATDGNGLYCLDKHGAIVKHLKSASGEIQSLSHNKVKTLLLDENGLWIGTISGLDFYNFKTEKFLHFLPDRSKPEGIGDDRIYDLKKDGKGNIWIATYRAGLFRLDVNTKTFHRFGHAADDPASISSNSVTFIFFDSQTNLWAGTSSGLNKMAQGSNQFQRLSRINTSTGRNVRDYILCIFEDSKHNIWFGTRDEGLQLLTGSKVAAQFRIDDGLPGNTVNGILEDANGYLWISTNNGLSRFDYSKKEFKNYSRNDGLACEEFNFNSFHKDARGVMHFGGYNGIVRFHPDSILGNSIAPQMRFTKLNLFNKEVNIGKGILKQSLSHTAALTLNHTQNIFSIEFTAMNFINPYKNRFAYKLEGFEREWNYVADPVATYMNLSPGDYTLSVKACNNDGVWTERPITLGITILPPPWKTWWAYAIYSVVILVMLYWLIRFNKMRWKLAHDLKIEHLQKEQQEKLHTAKLNFFTNIAHEIRTPLTLIVSPVELLLEKHPENDSVQKQLTGVKSNVRRLMRLIDQLLDFQKQETGNLKLKLTESNLVVFLKEIVHSFSDYASRRHIALGFEQGCEELKVKFDHGELEKVFYNLLHNAFKFTPGGGRILVYVNHEVDRDKTYAKVVIEDNGIGIASKDLPRIFNRFFQVENNVSSEAGFGIGLALTKGVIDLHNGSIEVESDEAEIGHHGFTRFTIRLPLIDTLDHDATDKPIVENDFGNEEKNSEPAHSSQTEIDHRPIVLLVEDNAEIRQCVKAVLESEYNILEANDGNSGWETAVRYLPDLVICDVAMPTVSGIELTRKIKADERTSHLPVIFLTARGSLDHQIEGISSGADDYITKPFHAELLRLKIRNLLALREGLKAKYRKVVVLEPQSEVAGDPDEKFLKKLVAIVDENLSEPEFNVSMLTEEIGMSRPVLFRKIKMMTGLSVIDLIKSTRLKKASQLLRQKGVTVSDVAFQVGFNDPKYFSKAFREQFGKTPTQYMEEV